MPENTKKFLWLAASVSLFALVVVGAAFIFFAPAKTSRLAPFDLNGKAEPKQESPQDYLADAPADAGTTQTTSSSGDIIIVYGNNPDAKSGEAPAESQQKPATTTIIVTPSATTTPRQAETPKASPPVPAAKPAVQPSAKAPAAKTAAATPKAAPAPAASTKPPAVAASPGRPAGILIRRRFREEQSVKIPQERPPPLPKDGTQEPLPGQDRPLPHARGGEQVAARGQVREGGGESLDHPIKIV